MSTKILHIVDVRVRLQVVTEYPPHATAVAEAAALSRVKHALTDSALRDSARVAGSMIETGYGHADHLNLDHYTCVFCNETTPKYDWGPGWVRCPKCGKLVPSASETSEMTP